MDSDRAEDLNIREGDNKLPEPEKVHPIILFLKEITNWFAILLWIGAILSTCIYLIEPDGNAANLYLALALVAVILITGVITYLQTAKSQEIMEKFRDMLPSSCKVIRDGTMISLPAVKIVKGDLVEIADGERIPADLRIIHSQNMKVDNSSITGETTLLLRDPESSSDEILEAKNVAFFGTHCKMGRGRGIVISIGAQTYLGSVA
jgi:sodium/potassium-transporting ATPase subunit alpha